MVPLTDRQRVELALIPTLLQGLIAAGAFIPNPNADDPEAAASMMQDVNGRLAAQAREAADEPLRDLPAKKFGQLYRRVTKLAIAISADLDRQPGIKIAMVLYYVAQDLLSQGILELAEGSPCAAVLLDVIEMSAPGFEQERLDASAQKQARRLLGVLQREGLFRGATSGACVA